MRNKLFLIAGSILIGSVIALLNMTIFFALLCCIAVGMLIFLLLSKKRVQIDKITVCYLALILSSIINSTLGWISFQHRFFPSFFEQTLGSISMAFALLAGWAIVMLLAKVEAPDAGYQSKKKIITAISMSSAFAWFILAAVGVYSEPLSLITDFYNLAIIAYATIRVIKKRTVINSNEKRLLFYYLLPAYLIVGMIQYFSSVAITVGVWDYWSAFYFITLVSGMQGILLLFIVMSIFQSQQESKNQE